MPTFDFDDTFVYSSTTTYCTATTAIVNVSSSKVNLESDVGRPV